MIKSCTSHQHGISILAIVAISAVFSLPDAAIGQSNKIILNGGDCNIPLLDGSGVSILPNSGDLEASTFPPDFCSLTSTTAEVTVEPLNAPAEVEQGGTFTVNLASLGARECRRTGLAGTNWPSDWSTPSADEFTVEIPPDMATGSKTFEHECRNVDFASVVSDQISVTEVELFACTDTVLNPGWTRDNAILLNSVENTTTWQDVFGELVTFPTGNWQNITVASSKFGALAFDPTGLRPDDEGRFTSQPIQGSTIDFGATLMSISPCPGDFRIDVLGACLQEIPTIGGAFTWSANPTETSSCVLPDANPLYLNIAYGTILTQSDGSQRVSWRCTTASGFVTECGSRLEPL